MVSARTKYLSHTILSCVALPAIVWVMGNGVVLGLMSGVITAPSGNECAFVSEPMCFSLQLAVKAFFAMFFAYGSVVAWADLINGRRAGNPDDSGLAALFRSNFLIERTWLALPICVVAVATMWIFGYL